MIVCDRCHKQASKTLNILPSHGVDLCERCLADYNDIVSVFMVGQEFVVNPPKIGNDIQASDPVESNVVAK